MTSEPSGDATPAKPGGKKAKAALSFVIQKHAATRLHYDFRLELDGVLMSWAVTRGPSLIPGEKRLAVHVEDHPLDYGSFEGTIPAGEYGGGNVLLWDRGTWTPEGDPHKGLAKGHLSFSLDGEKLDGAWHLVRMRGKPKEKAENWLLIKSDDDEARGEDDGDILEDMPRSVASGRSIEEIGGDKKSKTWHSNKPAAASAPSKPTSPKRRAAMPLEVESAPKPNVAAKSAKGAKLDVDLPKGAMRGPLPGFTQPQLATLAAEPPTGAEWLHEIKFDGYRMQATISKGKAVLRTRKGLDWTARFKPVAEALASLPVETAVFDGEVVVEDANGVADFAGLQQALHDGDDERLVFYLFDCLYLNGHDLTRLPLVQRKSALETLSPALEDGPLRYSTHFDENGELLLKHVCRLSAEGLISKRRDAPYRSGRGGDWVKSKCANRQEFVIVGYVPSTASRKAIGSLVVGYYQKGKLLHAGRVGTGYSADLSRELFDLLAAEKVAKPSMDEAVAADARKNVVWVKPTRVAEVEFRGWTGASQLRQASFKGLREDKDPREIIREDQAMKAATQTSAKGPTKRPEGVRLTHPDRLLWSEAGVTKEGLADYYTSVWPQIEAHLVGRPLALVRCPTGVGHCFFQKHAWEGMGSGIVEVDDPDSDEASVAITGLEGLLALVQASVLEIHPWGSSSKDLERPDRLILDLDPGDDVDWSALVEAAHEARRRFEEAGLRSFVKTTGGKGLHVVAPLVPSADWDEAKAFCKAIADGMAADQPALYVSKMTKSVRKGRIYVDYLRNGRGATAVAAFSTRARPACGVSTPLSFEELETIRSGDHFTLANIGKRLAHLDSDPWADFFKIKQKLAAGGKVATRKAASSRPVATRKAVAKKPSGGAPTRKTSKPATARKAASKSPRKAVRRK